MSTLNSSSPVYKAQEKFMRMPVVFPTPNPEQTKSIRKVDVLLHLGYWVIAGLYYHRILVLYYGATYAHYKMLIDYPPQILFTYAHIRWVLPILVRQKKYFKFVGASLLCLVLLIVFVKFLFFFFAHVYHLQHIMPLSEILSVRALLAAPLDYSMLPAFFVLLYIIKTSYYVLLQNEALINANKEAQIQKKEAEINLLKAQINPHFLFNTLNSLYGLSLAGSKHAAESVYQLSNIMQYMMFESNKETIALHKELEYIENYIALEQIRYGDRLKLSMSINVPSSLRKEPIAPLLLLPFLENAFKHGASRQDGNAWIVLSLSIIQGRLRYHVKNSCKPVIFPSPQKPHSGLEILRYRLAQIYPGRYFISTEEEGELYTATFEIDLISPVMAAAVNPTDKE